MGSPSFPTLEQQAKLRLHAEQTFAAGVQVIDKNPSALSLTLKPSALAIVEFCQG
jgi:hypothetical protein